MENKDLISSIIESSFSEVSDQYLEAVSREIAKATGVQTVMIHRLLTYKEYIDLKYNEGCPHVQLISHPNHHPYLDEEEELPMEYPDDSIMKSLHIGNHNIEYLFIKACYSSLTHPSLVKYTAAPISSFPTNSPHLKAIQNSKFHFISHDIIRSVYPPFKSFVGIRLDIDDGSPIGLISVMDETPLSKQQINQIQAILAAVQKRTRNEIERIRQKDLLMMMKNAALRDAESKIKFLAEMSHEIRTPMSAVVALTDLMLQDRHLLNEEQAEHLNVIQTSGNHLLTVINDILDISKMNNDPQFKLESRKFNIRKCVKEALNMARHQASMTQSNKIVTVTECPCDLNNDIPLDQLVQQLLIQYPDIFPKNPQKSIVLPLIWSVDPDIPDYLVGDSMRVTQILLNLCSNAVKFTKSGGIRVKISKSQTATTHAEFKDRYDANAENAYSRLSFKGRKEFEEYHQNHQQQITPEKEDQIVDEKVELEITVTDTGIGMPSDRLPRLFKSFSQIDISTARRYGGTGLGLAITSMLVNRMGGKLWVESEEGIGSRFTFILPILVANDHCESDSNSSKDTNCIVVSDPPSPYSTDSAEETGDYFFKKHLDHIPHHHKSSTHNLKQVIPKSHLQQGSSKLTNYQHDLPSEKSIKILLAEDNILNQKIALGILKKLGYQDVTIASNGREVLDFMRIYKFDVIFMDMYMPEMDGLETTQYIMSERTKPSSLLLNINNVHIVALTASASNQDRQTCIDAGMDDFLSKPFTTREMKSALKNLYAAKKKKLHQQQRLFIVPANHKQPCHG